MLKISTKFGVAPQSFLKIKILFRIRIRIRIIILLWISIPDLHFRHRRHPPNFVWTPSKVIVSTWKVHVRTYIQTDGKFFLLVLSSKTYKTWTFVKRREFFFFYLCDYNTFSFYILRIWRESKNHTDFIKPMNSFEIKKDRSPDYSQKFLFLAIC